MTGKNTILTVDDNPTNLKLLEGILRKDYEVIATSNGFDALEICAHQNIALILLDVMMPDMDGYEVCERIKADRYTKHIPVIFLTAKVDPKDIVHGFEVGGVDYITKPFNRVELLARVKTHVELQTLKGILHICASCKDIRDADGQWKRIESYVASRSEAEFSHDVCPSCAKKIYPDLVDENGNFKT